MAAGNLHGNPRGTSTRRLRLAINDAINRARQLTGATKLTIFFSAANTRQKFKYDRICAESSLL